MRMLANSKDPDEMPHNAAFNQGIQCWLIQLARRLRAKIWPDCAIPDTSMKFGTFVDHD